MFDASKNNSWRVVTDAVIDIHNTGEGNLLLDASESHKKKITSIKDGIGESSNQHLHEDEADRRHDCEHDKDGGIVPHFYHRKHGKESKPEAREDAL